MASILDRYGIKEVADVTFYDINEDGSRGNPVLYLDTLKVSTIEQTAETSDARGGKGNPKLITWDYGKDITVTLEDALFSAKSLSIMFGNGTVNSVSGNITKTVMARLADDAKIDTITIDVYDATSKGSVRQKIAYRDLAKYKIEKPTVYDENSNLVVCDAEGKCAALAKGDRVFITYEIPVSKKEIIVSADTFPGTYYVTGDTYARSDVTGADQFFQFIIQKAKVTSENTITLEAEGDPSVFNMNLTVLRPEDGEMMKLVQYDLAENRVITITGPSTVETTKTITLISDVIADAASAVTWSSDDQSEATVIGELNEAGYCVAKVTGKAPGAVTITAKLASDETVVGTYIVSVQNAKSN